MNEKVRNNVFFHSAKDFKQQILSFFTDNCITPPTYWTDTPS
jgi:hypothetical protein